MGQSASSTRCPDQRTPPRADGNSRSHHHHQSSSQDVGGTHTESIPTTLPTTRRRSLSPDPDSIDSRRSVRIRRRLSRFVTSSTTNDTVNYAIGNDSVLHAPGVQLNDISQTNNPSQPLFPSSRVRLPRLRTRPQRSVSPNSSNRLSGRRVRPFSMLTPRLGSFPLLLPRSASISDSLGMPEPPTTQSLDFDDLNMSASLGDTRGETQDEPLYNVDSATESEPLFRPGLFLRDRNENYDATPSDGEVISAIDTASSRPSRQTRPSTLSMNSTSSSALSSNTEHPFSAETSQTYRRSRSTLGRSLRDIGGDGLQSGEDQAAVLSRLLSVAAAATAASLVGNNDQALSDARDVAGESVDGSFEAFLRALQNGRLAAALRSGGNENRTSNSDSLDDVTGSSGVAPLNFFRMFRFGTASSVLPATVTETSRMVPVIIVGIRSVTPRDGGARDARPAAPFLEALSNIPSLSDSFDSLPNDRISDTTAPSVMRRSDHSPLRQNPISATDLIDNSDPPISSAQTASNETNNLENQQSLGTLSPSLLLPSISGTNSDTSTRSGRFPTSNGISSTSSGRRILRDSRHLADRPVSYPSSRSRLPSGSEASHTTRHERTIEQMAGTYRPEADGRRYSSHPQNNSVPSIASDNTEPTGSSMEGTRSWIIYVLGGSYPENHPILTTPSLFTDTPTYEDMMLLSSLIGPVKPPVATQRDLESAGGTFTLCLTEGLEELLVTPDGTRLQMGERCLVCLSDFEVGEKCRQLLSCQHVFHKDCIDEWLTTGRNSCPLCRGKGVEDTSNSSANEDTPASENQITVDS